MKFRVPVVGLVLVLSILPSVSKAQDLTFPLAISTNQTSVQETNFYTLNIDSLIVPNATTLITAVSGSTVFIGDRPTRTIYRATIVGNTVTLIGVVPVPAPLEPGHPNNALLDMVANSTNLYLAVADGAKAYPACGGARIYEYQLSNLQAKPRLIFKSTPCVDGDLFYDARLAIRDGSVYIAGGNSLANNTDGTFPLADSQDFVEGMPFPKTNYFGALSAIDIKTKKVTAVATGLRHLGGLYWDAARKTMWETENGPRGGDEVNIMLAGKNYGWPQVTLGRPYDSPTAPSGGIKINTVGKSQPPIYGWTPSISPSTIRKVPAGGQFSKYWAGDLIVGSLKGNQLRRLRISATNTVMYDEPIPVGDRIRTLDFLNDGRLLLTTDTGRLMLVSDSSILGTGRYPKDPAPPVIVK